jgi:hypothetical protein
MGNYITSYCRIKNQTIEVNGKTIPITENNTGAGFLIEAYKQLGLNYPKFHKMDAMCKLGFIATEAALQGSGFIERNKPENIAIVITNKSSSLDTDRVHQNSINDIDKYLPSPSVFVYTLPNIIIGEIAIKNKIIGENAFFVAESFDEKLLVMHNKLLINQSQTTALISGWVDYDNGVCDALIYLVEMADDSIKNSNFKALNEITLKQLY